MKNKDNLVKKTNAKKENGTNKINLPNKEMEKVKRIGGSIKLKNSLIIKN